MSSELTGTAVWETLLADPVFRESFPEGQLKALRPFVEGISLALAEHLDRPVTLKSLLEAKAAFIRHLMEGGFAVSLLSTISVRALFPLTREQWIEMVERQIECSLAELEDRAANVERYLEAAGMTEEEAFAGPMGFSEKNLAKYRAGELTISDLLLSQPILVAKPEQ